MPGDSHSYVLGSTGPSHHGSGTQNVYVGVTPPGQGRDPLHIVRERRARLRRVFVHPGNYGEAAHRLEAPGAVVLLQGPAGIGRSAAATVLLHEAADTGAGEEGRFEELTAEKPEGPLDAGPRDRFLLDLTGTSYKDYPEAQETLASYRAAVEHAKARMVVVLPAALDHVLDPQFAPLVVPLERPQATAVVRLALRVAGIECDAEQLRTRALEAFMAEEPMRELARFCEMVRRVRDGGRHGTEFGRWCQEALDAVTNRADEAARQVADLQSADDRALLLTAAMLHGACEDAVFHSRNALLTELGHGDETPPGLAQPDLLAQLEKLRIRRNSQGQILFEGLEYDAHVRRHFWLHYPALRAALGNWVDRTIRLDDLTGADRAALVARFTEQALGAGLTRDWLKLAESWAESHSPRLHEEARAALELGLGDQRQGRVVRDRILGWAGATALPPGLLRVLTEVCGGMMSATHPHQAVVRLHHLALQPRGAEARTALFELVQADRRLRRFLISRIAAHTGRRSVGNLGLLLELFPQAALPSDLPWPELVGVWRGAMEHSPPDDWSPLIRTWLTASALMPGVRRESALGCLVQAVAGSDRRSNQLYATTCAWAEGRPERESTATRLWQEIDTVQGIEPDGAFASAGSGGAR
ncbi:hypothetical protein [Streptomyces sp. NBC_00091]|uniref:hypothetical protein n=1 Tax=Streptomyces sp. NBC_00091 TaxID=2975648 RepID=UPI002259F686|nr:hypothetical protein [Streptomyces sp. NBC_00091]MCX5375858.1 hypothetical protein [Streptomyces sp. NBC_00091]